jgi:hypothetical protein
LRQKGLIGISDPVGSTGGSGSTDAAPLLPRNAKKTQQRALIGTTDLVSVVPAVYLDFEMD